MATRTCSDRLKKKRHFTLHGFLQKPYISGHHRLTNPDSSMPWYFRKSIKFGPGRLTFSKSGLSYSIGTKGARITSGPRGTYVTFGTHGIYYRTRIMPSGPPTRRYETPSPSSPTPLSHTITSAAIEELTDSDSRAFVDELNTKARHISYFRWFCITPAIISVIVFLTYFSQHAYDDVRTDYFLASNGTENVNIRKQPDMNSAILGTASNGQILTIVDTSDKSWNKIQFGDSTGYISKQFSHVDSVTKVVGSHSRFEADGKDVVSLSVIGSIFFIFTGVVFYKQDKARLLVAIHYEIDDKVQIVYEKFLTCFAELLHSRKVWQYLNIERTADYKRNAGATNLVTRTPVKQISTNKKPARFFRTNISIPNIQLKNTDLYFFPERLLIKRNGQFASVFYKNLNIQASECTFVEEEGVSSDAQIVGYTWRYTNKDGSPDGRFKNNRQLPRCRYSEYHFSSGTGINELLTTSKMGGFDNFAHIVSVIGQFQQAFVTD